MPTKKKKSVVKRARQNERKRIQNVLQRSSLKTAVKKVRAAENQETAKQELVKTSALLDRLAAKKIIHKNKAANLKSKLAAAVRKK
jgi:small subunit ribosomal protein S20